MKNKTNLIIIASVIGILIIGSISFYLYNARLNQSKEEAKNIVSRAVPITQTTTSNTNNTTPKTNLSQTANSNTNNATQNTSTIQTAPSPVVAPSKTIKKGNFVTLDPLHYANGTVDIVENGDNVRINFSSDFSTNPDGPDLYVWLVKTQDIKNIAVGGVSTNEADYLDLGPIQSKSGAQAYQVTKSEFQKNDYAVVIWCRAFGVQFSNAILK